MEFGGSWSSFFMYLQYCTTDLLYMCSKQKHMADHGHKKGRRDTHHGHMKGTRPRASQDRALRF